jgi:hypothetical protein
MILASILLLPFALAQSRTPETCDPEPCLPPELGLTPAQQQQLQQIGDDNRRRQDALRQEMRDRVLRVLTPEQTQRLKTLRPEVMERQADRLRDRAQELDTQADRDRDEAAPARK